MNIFLVGNGGREHAIAKKISSSPLLTNLYFTPYNPGIASIGKFVDIPYTKEDIVSFSKNNNIDLIISGPEQLLVDGLSDHANQHGIKVFGPSKSGAILEGSKIYSKELMKKYKIPTADYNIFYDYNSAKNFIDSSNIPIVIKADGLAAGKGVAVAMTRDEAYSFLKKCFIDDGFGSSGRSVVIEEFMEGVEMSALFITDGNTFLPLIAAKDYKRIFDNDKGPNTGGMGSFAPHNLLTQSLQDEIDKLIISPLRAAFKSENIDYNGVLYVGLMLTNSGPKVVEFNCRFGDPETQAILPLMENDLLQIMFDTVNGKLNSNKLEWLSLYSCCVVIASKGYPDSYLKNIPMTFKTNPFDYIHCGTTVRGNSFFTNGGRVLNSVGLGETLALARENAYKLVDNIDFDGKFFRKDIAYFE